MAMGPLAVGDMAGLDISYRARRNRGIESGAAKDGCIADAPGGYGQIRAKDGKGSTFTTKETRKRQSDPEIDPVIEQLAKNGSNTPYHQ